VIHRHRKIRYRDYRRRRRLYRPDEIYRDPTGAWEYIPIHPFGDEDSILSKLKLTPADCHSVDAWSAIAGDATLIPPCL
jgi:hypothetical protein